MLDEDFVAWIKGDDPAADENWQQWLTENPAGRREVEKARLLWQAMSFQHRRIASGSVEEAWQQLNDKTVKSTPDAISEAESNPKRVFPLWGWLVAASVVLLLGVWVGKGYLPRTSAPQLSQIQTADGQQLTITLTDGTTVRLNAGSTLTYPAAFDANKREVQLDGEGYFDVASNAAAPFLIRTGEVDVQVIGTKFTVKAYPESDLVKVAVVEGKVAVQTAGEETTPNPEKVLLAKDEMATLEKSNGKLSVSGYDKNVILGWQNGILYFEKADFTQIMSQLERWYGVEISVEDNVEVGDAWRFSGKFENKSIDYILDVCRYPELFAYQISDKKVRITKQ